MKLSLLSLSLALVLSCAITQATPHKKQRSVIQLISDGYGPASATFARSYMQARDKTSWDAELALDQYHVGSIRTRSTDSLVTDSAASATAYSCGLKSVNAFIGVDIDEKPCGTILEAAKEKGYSTALVTTSRITHATPASYSAHINDRDLENEIAAQQLGETVLGRTVDILWGGGLRHFLPNTSSGGLRTDGRDLTKEAKQAGWNVILNRTQFDAEKKNKLKLPSLALFTRSHMAYEIDRVHSNEPSLGEMAIKALNGLQAEGKPFFIMIEGARIDHAAHNNDPVGHLHDILEYQKMFHAVTKWVQKNEKGSQSDPEYVVISTSDHECGGLTLAEQRTEDSEAEYLWYPDVLFNANHSTEYLAADFIKATANQSDSEKRSYMSDAIIKGQLGVADAQDDEINRSLELASAKDSGLSLTIWLASIVNWRAHLGWSTTGHSGVDVPLYVYTKHYNEKIRNAFSGNHENTWIGQWTREYLNLDLNSISYKLNNNSNANVGSGSSNKLTPIARYHGGVKRTLPPLPGTAATRRSIGYSHADNIELFGSRGFMYVAPHEVSHSSIKRAQEL